MKTVYLDNAGSTQVCPEALDAAFKTCNEIYANPSAIHLAGVAASKELDKAYEKITLLQAVVSDKKKAKKIKKSAELLEAANLAIKSLEVTLK